MQEFKTISTAA